MDKLCRIRDLQRAVNQFEAAFEKRYGICLNEGMALCSLSNAERMCPGRLGELLGLTPSNTSKVLRSAESKVSCSANSAARTAGRCTIR